MADISSSSPYTVKNHVSHLCHASAAVLWDLQLLLLWSAQCLPKPEIHEGSPCLMTTF